MSSRPVLFKRGISQGLVLLVLLVAIGGVVAAAAYTETDKYCSSCHSMKPSAETWANGSHADTGCAECHMEPGFTGWLANRFSI
ncbi:MAG TPA: NapC/NirT family cytochrome c, partial [Bacillota bacterium]|nr:NapC/NirT family cytochrome c [Bacillota bacterium]